MKEGKGETVWVLMELCGGLGGTEGMGCPQTYSCVAGAPSGGSHHFLLLWEHERITHTPTSPLFPLSQIL